MYKLDVISNGSKDYINLYKKNLNFSNKIINKIKEKRNSLDISHISKKSKNSQKKTNISENSLSNNNLNNIQRIKFFVQKKKIVLIKTRIIILILLKVIIFQCV